MTFALLAALIVMTALFILTIDRLIKRQMVERADHRAEVQTLLQRIQAPEIAVVQHQQEQAGEENPYPLSDVESAQAQQETSKWIAELERMENEGVFS